MNRTLACLAFCLFLLACRARNPQCTAMAERFEPCANEAAAKDLRLHCDVALGQAAEPPDAAPSLAELERRVFVDCVNEASCAGLTACLTRHQCSFVLTSPTDREPKLWCRGG